MQKKCQTLLWGSQPDNYKSEKKCCKKNEVLRALDGGKFAMMAISWSQYTAHVTEERFV